MASAVQPLIDSVNQFVTSAGKNAAEIQQTIQKWAADVEPLAERLIARAANGDAVAVDSLNMLRDDLEGTVRNAFQIFAQEEQAAVTAIAMAVVRTAIAYSAASS